MDVLQMSLTCFLLVVIFHPVLAQAPCPGCSPGYFVKVNCSNSKGSIHGVQCQPCTDCSAANLKTLYECSTYADSVCVNKSAPVVPTPKPNLESTSIGKISVETPSVEKIVIVVGVLLVCFLLLLGPTLTLLFCRGRCYTKLKGSLLPSHANLLPQQDKPPLSCTSPLRSGSTKSEADII